MSATVGGRIAAMTSRWLLRCGMSSTVRHAAQMCQLLFYEKFSELPIGAQMDG
jgi:hypothetical protein